MTDNHSSDEITIQIDDFEVQIGPNDTVADLLKYNGGSFRASLNDTAILRACDFDGKYPDNKDIVPFNLGTITEGDSLIFYRLKQKDRPVYSKPCSREMGDK